MIRWLQQWDRRLGLGQSMISVATSAVFFAWKMVIWIFTQIACLLLAILNATMVPQPKTGQPNSKALLVWCAVNICLFVWSAYMLRSQLQTSVAFGVAGLHFLVIVTALLVISEENDIWSGYIRYDRTSSSTLVKDPKDYRSFKEGRIVKSLPLIATSVVFYLAFLAAALKGYHSANNVLTLRYSASISIWQYLITVAAQIPIVDALVKWSGFKLPMEFQGVSGTAIKLLLHLTNVTIIVGTLNSYFRQKSQIRRLIEGLASRKGDIPFLQLQAQRAPDEIKLAIIEMAIRHPEAHTRRRAMAVAPYLNILTFPHTMVHNLHSEKVEQNKRRALSVSIEIVRSNVARFQPSFSRLLRQKIDAQLKLHRPQHSQKVLSLLFELRGMLPGQPRGPKGGDLVAGSISVLPMRREQRRVWTWLRQDHAY